MGTAQCVDEVLRSRRSIRAFRQEPISAHVVMEILDVAATAPSNSNTQPWRVHAVAGERMGTLSHALAAAFKVGSAPPPSHFPDPMPQEFALRQESFGRRYYSLLGIDRADMPARARQTLRNFAFFGAPVGLLFTINCSLTAHSWLDLGLFVQNVMVAAQARGIATCPQVSFARFHGVIAQCLPMDANEAIACGMSMGYADASASVNQLRTPRASASSFGVLRHSRLRFSRLAQRQQARPWSHQPRPSSLPISPQNSG